MTHLILRHSPYFGLPAIDIFLTSDSARFASWTGLDHSRWYASRFATEREVWDWLTAVEPDSLLGRGWKRLARPHVSRDVAAPGHKRQVKGGALNRFFDYLREPGSQWAQTTDPTTPTKADEVPPLSPSATSTWSSTFSDIDQNPTALDPEHPVPLDGRAQAALEYWGKTDEYAKELEVRKTKAREIAESRRRKAVARETLEAMETMLNKVEKVGLE